jgi:hypothetical protein
MSIHGSNCSPQAYQPLSTRRHAQSSADGSIVTTLPPGLTIIFYSHKALEAGSIVEQKNRELFEQKNTIPSGHDSCN